MLGSIRKIRYGRALRENRIDSKAVVFECYAGRAYACSPRAIYNAMIANPAFDSFEFYWVFRQTQLDTIQDPAKSAFAFGAGAVRELERSTLVRYLSPEYHALHARAGTWIANYIIPVHLWLREGQRYLQTWHGTPLKRLGCDLADGNRSAMYSMGEVHRRYRREGARFSWLISPSPTATSALAGAFGLDDDSVRERVLEIGYPRNDALVNADMGSIADIRKRLGVPEDDTVIMYAPTFRDDQHKRAIGYSLEHLPDFQVLLDRLGPGYTILFRAHYLIAEQLGFEEYGGSVIDVSDVTDINDLYLASDILVTDYSSVMFDFSLLRRPILLYMHDKDRYACELRGFYIDLDELPWPIVETTADLAAALASLTNGEDELAVFDTWLETYAPLDDGRAANRAIEIMFPDRLALVRLENID